jgi:hypothetical protein
MASIIDADGLIVEPRKLWEEYVEPEFRDSVIRVERSREGLDEFWINGERRRGPGGSIIASVIPGGYLSAERTRTASWEDILPGSWDPHARIKVIGEEGIDVAFLYPSFYLIYGDHEDPRLAVAACRAYNNLDGGLLPPLSEAAPRCRADANSGCRRGSGRDAPGGQRAQL